MKQQEVILVKERTKTKGDFIYKEKTLDIFAVHDQVSGKSLGEILKEQKGKIKELETIKDKLVPLMKYVNKHKKIFGGQKDENN